MLVSRRRLAFSAPSRRRVFKRRRVSTVPAGVPLAGTGGEDVAEREIVSVSRALRVPASKQVLRSIVTISSDGSGDILQAVSATDPSHASANDPFGAATNWSALTTIYDLYKPVEAIFEWFPTLPNEVASTASTSPMVVAFDPDSVPSSPAGEDELLQYGNARTFDVFRRFRYRIKIPKRAGAAVGGWLDVANPTAEPASIRYATTLLAASSAYGRGVVTLVCWFKTSR